MIRHIIVGAFWINFTLFMWTYFGYPLLMLLWSKLAPNTIKKGLDSLPSVTLLIPAYNEIDVIRRKIENSLKIDYPSDLLQIMIIDDGSTDGTREVIREYQDKGITLIEQPVRSGKMTGVNTGFQHATGEIVILSDASPNYASDALQVLLQPFADPSIGVVVGTLALWDAVNAVAKSAGLYWKYESALRKWESKTGSTVAVHGNMFAIRRPLFRPLNTGTINDEFSIAMEVIRQGYRVVYEPDAMSYDDASESMQDEFNRRVRINAGRFQALFSAGYLRMPNLNMGFRLFSHKVLRPLTPIFMLFMLVLNILLLFMDASPQSQDLLLLNGFWNKFTFFGQFVIYTCAILGWQAEKSGKRIRILNVPYYFVSSNIAALFGLWRWISKSQGVTWQKRMTKN